jgi:hypothetical protein
MFHVEGQREREKEEERERKRKREGGREEERQSGRRRRRGIDDRQTDRQTCALNETMLFEQDWDPVGGGGLVWWCLPHKAGDSRLLCGLMSELRVRSRDSEGWEQLGKSREGKAGFCFRSAAVALWVASSNCVSPSRLARLPNLSCLLLPTPFGW